MCIGLLFERLVYVGDGSDCVCFGFWRFCDDDDVVVLVVWIMILVY